MIPIRRWDRGGVRRLAAVDAYQFPASVRQRFALVHPGLTSAHIALVQDAARQWFRLAARHPRVRLSMPSVAADHLWHEFVLHTREYAQFCDAALGRFLHHVPETAPTSGDAVANQGRALQTTFRLAQEDEGIERTRLPLLFRVDRETGIPGGRRYLADCGGRGICYELPGAVCLKHVGGVETVSRRFSPYRPPDADPAAGPQTAGWGGCGSGGG